MGKILVTFGAISALGFLAYKALYRDPGPGDVKAEAAPRDVSAPKQTLDNVRTKARSILFLPRLTHCGT